MAWTRYNNLREGVIVLGILVVCGMPMLVLGLYICARTRCDDDILTIGLTLAAIFSQFWVLQQWRGKPKIVMTITLIALVVDACLVILQWQGLLLGRIR